MTFETASFFVSEGMESDNNWSTIVNVIEGVRLVVEFVVTLLC
jgi:hypothetical protein